MFRVNRKEELKDSKNQFEFFTFENTSYQTSTSSFSKECVVTPIFFQDEKELTKWISEDVKNRASLKFYSASSVKVSAVVQIEITK